MKVSHFIVIILCIILGSCNTLNQREVSSYDSLSMVESTPMINDYGKTVLERFDAPLGYERVELKAGSFGEYLRTLSLKPEGSTTRKYDKRIFINPDDYVADIDLPIAYIQSQTPTDAIIRLKSEYHFRNKEFDKIVFHSNKVGYAYSDYVAGDMSRTKFNEYLNYVMDAVSLTSLCDDLYFVKIQNVQVGDIFIQKTNPNTYAAIVVDVVQNSGGQKLFLLAQNNQETKEIHIISNPSRDDISPWYEAKDGQMLTPDWRFLSTDLMRFKDLKN